MPVLAPVRPRKELKCLFPIPRKDDNAFAERSIYFPFSKFPLCAPVLRLTPSPPPQMRVAASAQVPSPFSSRCSTKTSSTGSRRATMQGKTVVVCRNINFQIRARGDQNGTKHLLISAAANKTSSRRHLYSRLPFHPFRHPLQRFLCFFAFLCFAFVSHILS